MKRLPLAVLLLAAAASGARAAGRPERELVPEAENFNSLKMEATAVMGELKYAHGELDGANQTFHDSLNDSTRLRAPQDHVVALDLYRTAEIAARKGDFVSAREKLELLTNRFPDDEFARRGERLLEALPRRRELESTELPATPVSFGESPDLALARLQTAWRDGRPDDALGECDDFLARFPRHPSAPDVELMQGALLLRSGKLDYAAQSFRDVIARSGSAESRAQAVHLLAAALYELGDYDGAILLVPDATSGRSWSRWITLAQVWRAASERRLGRRAEALRRLRAIAPAMPASPARAYAFAMLASLEDESGRVSAAQAAVARAASEASDWKMNELAGDLSLSRANLLFKSGKSAEAATAYGEFLDKHASHPQATLALYQRGLALKRLGRAQAAAASFQKLVDSHPESVFAADAHLQLGQLYSQLGDADGAVTQYQKMSEDGPRAGAESELLVAQVHYNAKRYKQAIPRYQAFLDAHPRDRRAPQVEDLLLTSYWLGDRDNAEMERAAARYPSHAVVSRIRWELAARAYRSGDAALAVELLQRYRADYPRAPHQQEALFYQAEAHLKLGQPASASALFERYLSLYPKSQEADEAWWQAARLREQAGRAAAAATAYEKVADRRRRLPAVYAAARLREKLGQKKAALKAYASLRTMGPAGDPARLKGLLRLAILDELAGKRRDALPLYGEILKHAERGTPDFETARQRVQALTEKL